MEEKDRKRRQDAVNVLIDNGFTPSEIGRLMHITRQGVYFVKKDVKKRV